MTDPERTAIDVARDASEKTKDSTSGYNAARVFLRGDENLSRIALQFGITTGEICRANPGLDFDDLGSIFTRHG